MADEDRLGPGPADRDAAAISRALLDCADDLEHFRQIWLDKDLLEERRRAKEESREPRPPRLPPSGRPRLIAHTPVPPGGTSLVGELSNKRKWLCTTSIPAVLPYVDPELRRRLMDLVHGSELEARLTASGGDDALPEYRWQQGWYETGLDREVTELAVLLRGEGHQIVSKSSGEGDVGAEAPSEPPTTVKAPPPSVQKAAASLEWARTQNPQSDSTERFTRADYNYIRENECPAYEGVDLPSFESWRRYLREYFRLTEGPSNTPRSGREAGRSIVREDEI